MVDPSWLALCSVSWWLTDVLRTGELQSVDGYMNIALEKTVEYVNGAKRRAYGDAFVRGNNGALSSFLDYYPPLPRGCHLLTFPQVMYISADS